MSTKISVLVADDEPMIRHGLAAILAPEPDIAVVGEAGDGAEAVSATGRHLPNVVLMDVRMPRVDGIEATRTITARWPDRVKVLVLTTFADDDYVTRAMLAGASGFLLKRASGEEITQAIRTVHGGESLLFPAKVRAMFGSAGAAHEAHPGFDRLTAREAEILTLVAEGLSNAEIARRLYVSVETVKTHVASVLTKLEVRDRTQAVVRAYRDRFITP
ncbi:response regulator [Actinopolymorpha singaporensis]|uniref:DNA-binding response regulator, NarL/FixJ family, contains REC and HTH domains n=1 Tax=Actinopolymorpha singaporensis TaxID=117157 RepID=A0A1H1NE21_9ACTN|nr:response regulator transcription factor [Actinopolymorpha singaporensis]SDR97213.1 DNA-binding response regulator, NarL/FixJ family, contains REC and HTH domains [Actinopolymorpha singaporensis]